MGKFGPVTEITGLCPRSRRFRGGVWAGSFAHYTVEPLNSKILPRAMRGASGCDVVLIPAGSCPKGSLHSLRGAQSLQPTSWPLGNAEEPVWHREKDGGGLRRFAGGTQHVSLCSRGCTSA